MENEQTEKKEPINNVKWLYNQEEKSTFAKFLIGTAYEWIIHHLSFDSQ